MFFDMGAANLTHLQSYKLIYEQYPSRVAVVPISQGSRRLVEVNFDVEDPNLNFALTKGLSVPSANSQILPCLAMNAKESELNIVRLSLSRLPLLRELKLVEGLKQSLARYGSIIDVGIYREQSTQTYMGTGYAILNRGNDRDLEPLSHNIKWDDTLDGFYATWVDMPKWCRYCHTEGHLVGECEILLSRTACFNCKQPGHKAAVCPRGNSGKRQRRLPSQPTESTAPVMPQRPTVTPTPVHTSNSFTALTYEEQWDEVVAKVAAGIPPIYSNQRQPEAPVDTHQISAPDRIDDTEPAHDFGETSMELEQTTGLDAVEDTAFSNDSITLDEQVNLMDEDDFTENKSVGTMAEKMNDATGDLDQTLDDHQPATDQLSPPTKEIQQKTIAALPTRTQPPRSAGRPSRYTH